MNFKALSNVLTSKVGRQILTVQKHSPALMFGAGVVGVVGTVVLACRATLRVEEILESHEKTAYQIADTSDNFSEQYTENDRRRDMMVLYARTAGQLTKLYGPSLALGIASIGALTGAHLVLNRRNVALTAAYAAVERGFAEYRKRVTDELGVDKDKEFRYGLEDKDVLEETETGHVVTTIKGLTGKPLSIYAVYFDESSVSWSRNPGYNQLFLQCQQNYANNLLHSRGHVFLNDVYDMLGLPRTKAGAVVGWVQGYGDDFVDFGVFEGDTYMGMEFVNGHERSVLLDFNVAGVIYDKI